MEKTPISVLQEFMTKRKNLPCYEFIGAEGESTHLQVFYYMCTVEDVIALGKGKNKKAAQHDAALNAIELLKEKGIYVPYQPTTSCSGLNPTPVLEDSSSGIPIIELQEFCIEHNLPEPLFVQINQDGPPHCPIFTCECKVATIIKTSTSTTKKKSKQSVAFKMFQHLKGTLPEELKKMTLNNDLAIEPSTSTEEINNVFMKNSVVYSKKNNWGLKIQDYPNSILQCMMEKKLTYEELWKDINREHIDGLCLLSERLELKFTLMDQDNLIFLMINTSPEFIFCIVKSSTTDFNSKLTCDVMKFLDTMSSTPSIRTD